MFFGYVPFVMLRKLYHCHSPVVVNELELHKSQLAKVERIHGINKLYVHHHRLQIGKTLSDSDTRSSADTNHSESGRSTQRAEAPPINGNGSANDRKPEDTDADADADADDDDDDDITTGSPFDWIIDSKSPVLQTALLAVRDRQLPLRIADAIGALEQRPGEAGCIQLLLCKCAPFVWGMQRSLAERIDGPDGGDAPDAAPAQSKEQQQQQPAEEPSRLDGFFRHLPAMREFRENGAECERRHASCFAKKSR